MKTSLLCLVPLLSCAVAGPSFAADAGAKPGEPKPEAKARQEIRVITTTDGEHGPGPQRMMRRMGGPSATETVTFLGSETGPVSPTLAARLGLSEGTGRVVNQLVPAGRAAVLKPHDILPKLEDQILTEQRQLAALVRGHKESDEITLPDLRAGKQSTAQGKRAKREVLKMRTMRLHQPQPRGGRGPGLTAPQFSGRRGRREFRSPCFAVAGQARQSGGGEPGALVDRRIQCARSAPHLHPAHGGARRSQPHRHDQPGQQPHCFRRRPRLARAGAARRQEAPRGAGSAGRADFRPSGQYPAERHALPAGLRERLEKP